METVESKMEMEGNETGCVPGGGLCVPPSVDDDSGAGEAALLRAISGNAECAHILAEIARGGDVRELLSGFMSGFDGGGGSGGGVSDDGAGPALYQSRHDKVIDEKCVTRFYAVGKSDDFWDF